MKGWRSGENPAAWRGNLRNLLPKRQRLQRGHQPAMPYVDIPAFIERLRVSDAMAARALEFTILTVARSGEMLGATWKEIDFKAKLWNVPKERMKAGVPHTVPLSIAAMSLLEKLHLNSQSEFVFMRTKDKPLSNMAMMMLLRRMKHNDITVHGFRSSFRDWCGDTTSFPREVAEAALAHKVGDEMERAYRRSDALEKRRKLMQAWADYIGTVVELAMLMQAQELTTRRDRTAIRQAGEHLPVSLRPLRGVNREVCDGARWEASWGGPSALAWRISRS